MEEKLKAGEMYYYGANNDIIEIKKVSGGKVHYIQNREEYVGSENTVRSQIERAGNRKVSSFQNKIQKINGKIEQKSVLADSEYLEHKELLTKVIAIVFGKHYGYKADGDYTKIVHNASGIEFEFNPLKVLSHATKEVLPWLNIHGFLYHFKEEGERVTLSVYNGADDLQSLTISEKTKNLCLLKGLVEAEELYNQNISYNNALLSNVAKNIYKNRKIEEKSNYMLIVLDRYNEEYIEFNPLKNTEQAVDIVLGEIGKVFDYEIKKKGKEYTLSIFNGQKKLFLEERHKDLRKLICIVYESLLGD